jgi:curved DNA-binding protein CbpA
MRRVTTTVLFGLVLCAAQEDGEAGSSGGKESEEEGEKTKNEIISQYSYCKEDNCYDLLGVKTTSAAPAIKRAYRKLAAEWHPDKNPDPRAKDLFQKYANAYEVLSSSEMRANYDYLLAHPYDFPMFFLRYSQQKYAPKTDLRMVLFMTLAAISTMQYLMKKGTYDTQLTSLKKVPDYKFRLKELLAESVKKEAAELAGRKDAEAAAEKAKAIVTPSKPEKPGEKEKPAPMDAAVKKCKAAEKEGDNAAKKAAKNEATVLARTAESWVQEAKSAAMAAKKSDSKATAAVKAAEGYAAAAKKAAEALPGEYTGSGIIVPSAHSPTKANSSRGAASAKAKKDHNFLETSKGGEAQRELTKEDPNCIEKLRQEAEVKLAMELSKELPPPPRIADTICVDIFKLPLTISYATAFQVNWILKFKIGGQEYGEEEKAYLTKRALSLGNAEWDQKEEEEKAELLALELWIQENKEKYDEDSKGSESSKPKSAKEKRLARALKKGPIGNVADLE